MTIYYIIAGLFIIVISFIGIRQEIRFRKSKKKPKNIKYKFQQITYPSGSRRQRILKSLIAERYATTPILSDLRASVWAEKRAHEMDIKNEISHNGIGKTFIMGADAGADAMGEIIAYGFNSGGGAVNGWMASEPHAFQILSFKYDYCGIACVMDEFGHWIDVLIFIDEKTVLS